MPAKAAQLKACQTDSERREWLCNFALGPTSGGCCGWNRQEVTKRRKEDNTHSWLTIDEMASSRYLNNRKHAEAMAEDLESRPQQSHLP